MLVDFRSVDLFILFGVHSLLEYVSLSAFPNLGSFQLFFLQILFQHH